MACLTVGFPDVLFEEAELVLREELVQVARDWRLVNQGWGERLPFETAPLLSVPVADGTDLIDTAALSSPLLARVDWHQVIGPDMVTALAVMVGGETTEDERLVLRAYVASHCKWRAAARHGLFLYGLDAHIAPLVAALYEVSVTTPEVVRVGTLGELPGYVTKSTAAILVPDYAEQQGRSFDHYHRAALAEAATWMARQDGLAQLWEPEPEMPEI